MLVRKERERESAPPSVRRVFFSSPRFHLSSQSLSVSLFSLSLPLSLSLNLSTVCNYQNDELNLRVHLRLDHVGGFLDGANLLGPFFVERDFELLFQRHHDFDGVQRIGAQVDKLGIRGDGVEVGAELLGDDRAENALRKSVWSHFGVFCELYPKQEMEEEKRTAAALTENPARALVATLLEVLKFTCLKLSCKDERERTRFVSIIIIVKT